jgi:hypothetical protein
MLPLSVQQSVAPSSFLETVIVDPSTSGNPTVVHNDEIVVSIVRAPAQDVPAHCFTV